MGKNVFSKLMDTIIGEDYDDEVDEVEEVEEIEEDTKDKFDIGSMKKNNSSNNNNKVVSIHAANTAKVVIAKPYDFDEAAVICDHFKNRKIVVINTNGLDTKLGQRLLDFIGGASYIAGGHLQEVEKGIFILSPSNVEVSNTLKYELQNKGVFSFIK